MLRKSYSHPQVRWGREEVGRPRGPACNDLLSIATILDVAAPGCGLHIATITEVGAPGGGVYITTVTEAGRPEGLGPGGGATMRSSAIDLLFIATVIEIGVSGGGGTRRLIT